MPVSLSEAVQALVSGNVLSWPKFGDQKPGNIQLASPGARRLLHYLLSCDRTKVADAREDLFDGLIAAWQNTLFDPATTAKPLTATTHTGTWRLVRMESAGFGGLNLVDGPNFVLALNGESWCLDPSCRYPGRTGVRVFGDHIVELKDGGAPLDKTNVMLRCGSCHTRKTNAERARRMGA